MTGLLLVEDESLKLMLLAFLVSKIEKRPFDELIKAGMVADHLNMLHGMSSSDLLRLSKTKALRLYVQVDVASLNRCLAQMGQHKSRFEKQEYFITHHASPAMMYELFRMSQREQDHARVALGMVKPRGRPRLPDHRTRDVIHQAWHESASAQSSKIDRYYQLHRQFSDFTFAALHAVVNEFEEA
jgi:hypothetical protein